MKIGARVLDICYGLSVLAQVAQGLAFFLNLIILLDLPYNSG